MAIAEKIYVDPSALARLYFRQPWSIELANWRWRVKGAFPVTRHGRMEVINAIALGLFQERLTKKEAEDSWQWFDDDFTAGNLVETDLLWRAALNRATELSRDHSPKLGTRASDVLHVSCALELNLKHFLSFDSRQNALASAIGLKLVDIGARS